MNENFSQTGYEIIPDVLTHQQVDELREHMDANVPGEPASRFAQRNLLAANLSVQRLASSNTVMALARAALGPSARAVKATLFDKTAAANWIVPPHQDVTIAVQSRVETPGFGPWSEKAGVVNVQPPPDILNQMVAFRIHIDDCDETNGALNVWPGSHLYGRLRDEGIEKWLRNGTKESCPVFRGGIMAMRPLLIHASSKATVPHHRRVIHIEYAGCDLPGAMQWLSEIK